MSSGKVHKKANLITGFVLTGGALLSGGLDFALPVLVGATLGTIATPDMDVNAALPVSFMTKIPILRNFWRMLWRPYQLLVKHRSFWSHFPFVGTAVRCLYMAAWFFGILWILNIFGFGATPEYVVNYISSNGAFFAIVYLSYCIQDITHFILDL